MKTKRNGFTLIELIAVTAMTLVVATSLFGSMIAQQRSYAYQLAASDAAQNARAALSIVKNELRMAGWGLTGRDDTNVEFPAVGTCRTAIPNQYQCNGVDSGADSLRIISMVPTRFDDSTRWDGGSPDTHDVNDFPTGGPPTGTDPAGIPVDTLAFIDGMCNNGAPPDVADVDLVSITAATAGLSYRHEYTVAAAPSPTYPAPTCTGASAFVDGFKMGMARIVDFWVDRTMTVPAPTSANPSAVKVLPRLMMQVNADSDNINGSPSAEQVVAYNIDSFQVQYGIDLGLGELTPIADKLPDQVADTWCDDLNACDTTASSLSYTTQELAARVVAVRVAVVPLAESSSDSVGSPLVAFDRTISADKNRRWIFRSTVRLRNNELD
ncbi:MAG: type II secretion system protein [Myxococcota bacterium]